MKQAKQQTTSLPSCIACSGAQNSVLTETMKLFKSQLDTGALRRDMNNDVVGSLSSFCCVVAIRSTLSHCWNRIRKINLKHLTQYWQCLCICT